MPPGRSRGYGAERPNGTSTKRPIAAAGFPPARARVYGWPSTTIWPIQSAFFANRENILPWIQEYSPYALVTPDDPPIHLWYRCAPAVGEKQQPPTHSAHFGVKLKERLDEVGVRCELSHGGNTDDKPIGANDFLFSFLGETR
jgi:hypothetical protein